MVRCGEAGDPVGGGREFDAACGVAGFDREAGGEVGFPCLRWPEENKVASFKQIRAGGEVGDDIAGYCGMVLGRWQPNLLPIIPVVPSNRPAVDYYCFNQSFPLSVMEK